MINSYFGEEEMAMIRRLRDMAKSYSCGDRTCIPSGRYSDNEVSIWEMFIDAYNSNCFANQPSQRL